MKTEASGGDRIFKRQKRLSFPSSNINIKSCVIKSKSDEHQLYLRDRGFVHIAVHEHCCLIQKDKQRITIDGRVLTCWGSCAPGEVSGNYYSSCLREEEAGASRHDSNLSNSCRRRTHPLKAAPPKASGTRRDTDTYTNRPTLPFAACDAAMTLTSPFPFSISASLPPITPTQDITADALPKTEDRSPAVGSPAVHETLSTQLCPAAHWLGLEPLRLTLVTLAPGDEHGKGSKVAGTASLSCFTRFTTRRVRVRLRCKYAASTNSDVCRQRCVQILPTSAGVCRAPWVQRYHA